jgi:hypothetical protein
MDLSTYKFPEVTGADLAFPTFDTTKELVDEAKRRNPVKGMKKLAYLLLVAPFISLAQPATSIETDQVRAIIKNEKIFVTSNDSELKRRTILVYQERDTLYDITKKGKFRREIKFKPEKGLQIFDLTVITHTKYGWSSSTNSIASFTIYFD